MSKISPKQKKEFLDKKFYELSCLGTYKDIPDIVRRYGIEVLNSFYFNRTDQRSYIKTRLQLDNFTSELIRMQ